MAVHSQVLQPGLTAWPRMLALLPPHFSAPQNWCILGTPAAATEASRGIFATARTPTTSLTSTHCKGYSSTSHAFSTGPFFIFNKAQIHTLSAFQFKALMNICTPLKISTSHFLKLGIDDYFRKGCPKPCSSSYSCTNTGPISECSHAVCGKN